MLITKHRSTASTIKCDPRRTKEETYIHSYKRTVEQRGRSARVELCLSLSRTLGQRETIPQERLRRSLRGWPHCCGGRRSRSRKGYIADTMRVSGEKAAREKRTVKQAGGRKNGRLAGRTELSQKLQRNAGQDNDWSLFTGEFFFKGPARTPLELFQPLSLTQTSCYRQARRRYCA